MPDYTHMVEQCKMSRVILIRHATTIQNQRVAALQKENELRGTTLREWRDLYSDMSVYDNPLAPKGLEQCAMAAPHAAKVNFHTIFVSPMRRALETAYLCLKDHPNFQQIKFIIHPDVREKLGGSDDVPSQDIQGLFAEYQQKFNGNLDHESYWRHAKDEPMWYAYEQDYQTNENIQRRVQQLGGTEHLGLALYHEIRDRYPNQIESYKHVHERIENSKKDIQAYIEKTPMKEDEKVAVFAHSMTFRFWIATDEYWAMEDCYEQTPPPEFSYNVRNCEFYPDVKNFARWFNRDV